MIARKKVIYIMHKRLKTKRELEVENSGLLERLEEAESTLQAIQAGSVDAFVVSNAGITQVLTLKGTDYLYRIFRLQIGLFVIRFRLGMDKGNL